MAIEFIKALHGTEIAYEKYEGREPWVVFLGGFMSDMTGAKATALHSFIQQHGYSYLRFDYGGHGQSSGKFSDGTIGGWLADALYVIEKITSGNLVLVGSSMGGWMALHVALKFSERVKGLVGIASAPDFTYDLYNLHLSTEQKAELAAKGVINFPAEFGRPYEITQQLIEESGKYLLMGYESLPVTCPVRLIHGLEDKQVPWSSSYRIAEKVISNDVRIILDKHGDHRMSTDKNLSLLCNTVLELLQSVA